MAPSNGDSSAWYELLQNLVGELGARGGAVWFIDGQQLRLGPSVGLSPTEFSAPSAQQTRQRQLTEVIQRRRPLAVELDAQCSPSASGPAVLMSAAVTKSDRVIGAVEIVHKAQLPPPQCANQLQLLERACRLPNGESSQTMTGESSAPPVTIPPAEFPETAPFDTAASPPPPPQAVPVNWPGVMQWLKHLQTIGRLNEVAGVIANEGRLLWQVDRVSVVVPRGRSAKVLAVSGQDRVHHRANLIQTLRKLAKLVMDTKEPFRFGGGSDEIPPPLEAPLAEFAQLSGTRFLLIVPLLEPPVEPNEETIRPKPRAVLGAVIIEQMQHSQPEPSLVAHLDLMKDHLAAALHQAVWRESIFLLPVWSALGRLRRWLRGHRLAWTTVAVVALVGLITAMFLVPWDYRLDGKGRLMPVVQRDVFAPWDGQVVELFVAGGQRVSAGQPLVQLRNEDLQAEWVKSKSELGEKRKLITSYQAQLDHAERNAEREEATRLQGKIAETRIEVDGLTEREAVLKDRIDRLLVCSPIHGVVTTFQADQLLRQRPVQRGEVLLEVMDDNGPWRLELEVPEHRLGHILAAQSHQVAELPITFRLLTHPEVSYQATLSEVGTRAVTSEADGSVVELTASLSSAALDKPSIGAQVRARIGCGQKPLGYCLFGDVIEFVQKYLWW